MNKKVTRRGKVVEVSDTDPLNATELAQFTGVSRWTIQERVRAGYQFEFGTTTTASHYFNWLREHPVKRASRKKEDASRLERELSEAR